MDQKFRSTQMIMAAALALAATGAFAATHASSDCANSASGANTMTHERANPTANGNLASGNSQASVPRTEKDEAQNWNAAPAKSAANDYRAESPEQRYDCQNATRAGKNGADEAASQPSTMGAGKTARGGQG